MSFQTSPCPNGDEQVVYNFKYSQNIDTGCIVTIYNKNIQLNLKAQIKGKLTRMKVQYKLSCLKKKAAT